MSFGNVDPAAVKRLTLPGGWHGRGQAHEATVKVLAYTHDVESGKGPNWDKSCDRGSYAKFTFEIDSPTNGRKLKDAFCEKAANSGSKLMPWLTNLGMQFDDQGNMLLDPQSAIVGKDCAIELKDARQDKQDTEVYWDGEVKEVAGF